jgi:hypothetical protein
MGFSVKTGEQIATAAKKLLKRVHQQALAETAGPGKEIVFSLFGKLYGIIGFVHIVIVVLPDFPERLHADG